MVHVTRPPRKPRKMPRRKKNKPTCGTPVDLTGVRNSKGHKLRLLRAYVLTAPMDF